MTAPALRVPDIPAPRPPVEPMTPPRRERPASQYWDLAQAGWRTAR